MVLRLRIAAVLFGVMAAACGGASYATAPEAPMAPGPGAMGPPADMAGQAAEPSPAKEEMASLPGVGSVGGDEMMRRETTRTASLENDKKQDQAYRGPPSPAPPSRPSGGEPAGGKKGGLPSGPLKRVPNEGGGEPGSSAVQVQSPIIIYAAQLTMAVFEVAQSLRSIEDLAREVGGFLAKRDDTTITIRVPVGRFDESVKRIEKLGDMVHRNVTAEDVTEEFLDLEVRLKNARAMRDRLEQLLAKATKVEESLLIERELGRVAGEIERIEGRMKFLRDRASFSTITVTFQPRRTETQTPNQPKIPVPWLYELGLGRLLNL